MPKAILKDPWQPLYTASGTPEKEKTIILHIQKFSFGPSHQSSFLWKRSCTSWDV